MGVRKVLLNGQKVWALRRKRWKNRQGFAAMCGVSERELADIENEKRAVSMRTGKKVADALGTDVDSLKERQVWGDELAYVELSDLAASHRTQITRARVCDMAGDQRGAIFICNRILRASDQNNSASRAAVLILLATFLDNAGRHQEALDRLNPHGDPWTERLPKRLVNWAAYHRAIAHRRLGHFDNAERELRPLLVDPTGELWAAAKHQLGVVHQERSRDKKGSLLDQALKHFLESRRCWQEEHNHREGFSLRRMAQSYAQMGDLAGSIRCFVDAIEVFARCRCKRYVTETRKDLEDYALAKVRMM
jgi:tetratricopeptide (TPR) repeat protein